MNPRRILMLTAKFRPTVGGAQTHVFEISQALAKQQCQVAVVAERIPSFLPFHETMGNVDVYRAPLRSYKFLLFPVYVLVAMIAQWRFRADLIHAHFAAPCGLVGLMLSKLFRVPLVVTVHGVDVIRAPSIRYGIRLNPVVDRLIVYVLSNAAHIIACSQFTRKLVLDCGVDSASTSVIPNGTSLARKDSKWPEEKLRKESRRALGLPLDSCVLFTPRRIVRTSGIEHVIRAARILMDRSLNFRVLIAGDGPLRESLESLAMHLKLQDKVTFVGEVGEKKLERLYLASDIVLLPSIVEAFGLPVVEAMACHRPVITFNSGGPAEIVRKERTGIVVEETSAMALAEAIVRLIGNRSMLERFRVNSSRSAPTYDWLRIAARTRRVYETVLQRQPEQPVAAS